MNSKGWKLSLLVLSALAISACGQKKKNKPVSPFTGIWIERGSARAATTRVVGPNGCAVAIHRSFIVHGNGEVFTYIPDAPLNSTDSRDQFLGVINANKVFAPLDNTRQVSSGYYAFGEMEATGLMPNSTWIRDGQFLFATSYGQSRTFVQVSEEVARRAWTQAALCSDARRHHAAQPGVVVVPVVPPVQQGVIQQGFEQGWAQGQGPGPGGYPGQRPQQGPPPLNQDDK